MNPIIYALLSKLAYEKNSKKNCENNPRDILNRLNSTNDYGDEKLKEYELLRGLGLSIPDDDRFLISDNNDTGYFGMAVQKADGSFILVHRGTDELKDWLKNNSKFALNEQMPPQLRDANGLVEYIRFKYGQDVQITQTGHSLGGAVAQLSAHFNGDQKAIVFDSPGIEKMLILNKSENNSLKDSFDNYVINRSYVSDIGHKTHSGNVYPIDVLLPDDWNLDIGEAVENHSIDNFVDAFDEQGSIIKILDNPVYLEQLLRKRWDDNHSMGGRLNTHSLQEEYGGSFHNFKSAYLERYKDILPNEKISTEKLILEQENEELLKEIGIDIFGDRDTIENYVENHIPNLSIIESKLKVLDNLVNNI